MLRNLLILWVAVVSGVLCANASAAEGPTIDQTARFMAGLPQVDDSSPYKARESSSEWQKHQASISSHWKRLVDLRLAEMKKWSASDFQALQDTSLTMLYPFSGPDFVSADTFYPNAPRYVFFALEEIQPLPELASKSDRSAYRSLRAVDVALRDIYSKGYFITTHMQRDIEAKEREDAQGQGVLPVFLVFLARTGHEVLSVERVSASADGTIVAKDDPAAGRVDAVRFRFQDRGSTNVQELIYFSVNQHDDGLKRKPGYVAFLNNLGPTNTFMKAASYLLFGRTGEGFVTTRNLILEKSQTLFQDDTGMPLKHLDPEVWGLQLYGKYTKPIADFGRSCFQEDLETLYDKTPRASIKHLPFSMGYHIVGDGIQNHMVATKKPKAAGE